MKSILIIGIVPALVDFTTMPHVNAEMIEAGLKAQEQLLRNLGFDAVMCLVDLGETAEAVVRRALEEKTYEVVLIGAGVRVVPTNFGLFENLINVVHALAPQSKICFNTHPGDSTEAILRWTTAPGVAG